MMKEVLAIQTCFEALAPLSPESQERALKYLHKRFVEDQITKACSVVLMLHSIGQLKKVLKLSPPDKITVIQVVASHE